MSGNDLVDRGLSYRSIERIGNYLSSISDILWRCAICKHEWAATPSSILSGKKGCPICSSYGHLAKPAIFYIIQIGDLYKIGVAGATVKKRYYCEIDEYVIVKEIQFEIWVEGVAFETRLKRENKDDLYHGPPVFRVTGNAEVFKRNILENQKEVDHADQPL